jgi:exonuclease III
MPYAPPLPPPIPHHGHPTGLAYLLHQQQQHPPQPKQKQQPRPPGVTLATYNVQDGRNSRLVPVCRTLEAQQIDIALLTETRIPDQDGARIHTRDCLGYTIFATYTTTRNQGGLALAYRQAPNWHIESQQRHGPNVLSFLLISGSQITPVIGAYLPPTHLDDIPHLIAALQRFPQPPIVMGDLNVNLDNLLSPRNQQVAALLATYGLEDLLHHFQQRKPYRARNTWHQSRQGVLYHSRCDYILGTDRRLFEMVGIREPRYFNTDHHMVVGRYLVRPTPSHKLYLRGRKTFPLQRKWGPPTRADSLFQEVKQFLPPTPKQPQPHRPTWLSATTLQAVDARCSLRRNPHHDRTEARRLSRVVNASIKADRKRRTEEAGNAISALLDDDAPLDKQQNAKAAYAILRKWYKHHGDRPPKPSRQDLQTVTTEFAALYTKEPTPGDEIPTIVAPFNIDDSIPSKEEIEQAVSRLRNDRAPGPTGMRAEHLKTWLREATTDDDSRDATKWTLYCSLLTHMFETGEVPEEVRWSLLILLPKGDGGVRGIGLLELVWKHVEAIIDTRVKKAVRFHDSLHGFTLNRGTGTAMIEAKLQQELANIRQQPLFQVFLDLKKAYDSLDRDRALNTLRNYGMGPRLLRLIRHYWEGQQIVARQSGFYGPAFTATRGGTQGGIFTPSMFNICIDNVVRYWLSLVVPDNQVAANGLGPQVEEKLAVLYADDGLISSTDHEWLQHAVDALTGLFRRIGLETNAAKTKSMTCFPGPVATNISNVAYTRRMTGMGDSHRERQRRRVQCPVPTCGKDLSQGSLRTHLRRAHGLDSTALQEDLYDANAPSTDYRVSFPRALNVKQCPVPGCHGRARTRAALRSHFHRLHPRDTICILEEGNAPLPRCPNCDMHVTYEALNRGHTNTAACRRGTDLQHRRLLQQRLREANEILFYANGTPLERVEYFKYLGRLLSANNSDWPAVYKNLKKAKSKWALISRPLLKTGVAPKFVGMFYKAIVQSVLLYGCETWVITPPMLKILEGFHHRIARRITNKMPHLQHGTWVYPPLQEALTEAGLFPIATYISRRQSTIAQYLAGRPIHQLCLQAHPVPPQDAEANAPPRSRLFRYWTQPLILHPPPPPPPATA